MFNNIQLIPIIMRRFGDKQFTSLWTILVNCEQGDMEKVVDTLSKFVQLQVQWDGLINLISFIFIYKHINVVNYKCKNKMQTITNPNCMRLRGQVILPV